MLGAGGGGRCYSDFSLGMICLDNRYSAADQIRGMIFSDYASANRAKGLQTWR
jgi:hypothetical protein